MTTYLLPILYTLFVWWFSTGVILYLNRLPRWTYPWTMLAATVLLGVAFAGLVASRDDTRTSGAYIAFTATILVWAWQEVAFLLGFVTGPRRSACPPEAVGWRRAGYALQTLLHHELALIVLGIGVIAATWGADNPTGPATYLVLWVMRQSAKLNIFLGVRNANAGFLPPHLAYLESYFRRARMNALFPVSVAVGTWFAVLIWTAAVAPGIGRFEATSLTFVGALLSLAILEHWFLMLPWATEAIWAWGQRVRAPGPTVDLGTTPS